MSFKYTPTKLKALNAKADNQVAHVQKFYDKLENQIAKLWFDVSALLAKLNDKKEALNNVEKADLFAKFDKTSKMMANIDKLKEEWMARPIPRPFPVWLGEERMMKGFLAAENFMADQGITFESVANVAGSSGQANEEDGDQDEDLEDSDGDFGEGGDELDAKLRQLKKAVIGDEASLYNDALSEAASDLDEADLLLNRLRKHESQPSQANRSNENSVRQGKRQFPFKRNTAYTVTEGAVEGTGGGPTRWGGQPAVQWCVCSQSL